MKKIILMLLLSLNALADTLPPGVIQVKGASDGTHIGNVSDSLKVNITNTAPISGTVKAQLQDNSGNGINSTSNALNIFTTNPDTNYSLETGGNLAAILAALQGTLGISGTVSVSNFPSVQAVSQSGAWNTGRTWTLGFSGDKVDTSGSSISISNFPSSQNVVVTSSALPTGAATSALQTAGNSTLTTINTTLGSPFQAGGSIGNTSFGASQVGAWSTGRTWTLLNTTDSVNVGNFPSSQNVVVTSSALPTGASTSALQTTGNSTLSTISSQLPSTLGQKTMANSFSVTVASDQSSLPVSVGNFPSTFGVTQSTSPWVVSGTVTANAGTGTFQTNVTNANIPVTQSGAWTTGRTWSLLNTTDSVNSVQSGTWNLNNISGTISLPTGAATNSALVTINSTLGSPFQVGGSIGNTAFGISGTLPAFASTPTVNAAQSGAWTTGRTWSLLNTTDSVNVGNFPSSYPVTGTFWQTTQPVSVASLPLPTGAATAANQTTAIANQTNGTQETKVVDGSGNIVGPAQAISGINYLPVVLSSSGTPGSAVPVRSIQVAGSDGTNLQSLSTDTSGHLNINSSKSGSAPNSTYTHSYVSGNLSTSAFTTIITSTSSTINSIDIFDNSAGIFYLAYAATCGALSSSSNAIIVGAGGGIKDFKIPSGNCVGFQAIGSNITTGNDYMTFYQ